MWLNMHFTKQSKMPKNKHGVKTAATEAWQSITRAEMQRLVMSIGSRPQAVIVSKEFVEKWQSYLWSWVWPIYLWSLKKKGTYKMCWNSDTVHLIWMYISSNQSLESALKAHCDSFVISYPLSIVVLHRAGMITIESIFNIFVDLVCVCVCVGGGCEGNF